MSVTRATESWRDELSADGWEPIESRHAVLSEAMLAIVLVSAFVVAPLCGSRVVSSEDPKTGRTIRANGPEEAVVVTPEKGKDWTVSEVGLEMVWIEPEEFKMGSLEWRRALR